jgi:tetratricopeptide (TPR) repeat protein
MRVTSLIIAIGVLAAMPASAADWTSLRTEHFLLIGDASARDIRDVALRFEQFRAAVTGTFPALADDRPGPPVVILVFRDQRAYEPYQPRFNGKPVKVGGFYLPSRDVNYITLAADSRGEGFQAVYHEYAHLLLGRLAANPSPWFAEGLAEYFSSFEVAGRTARFGRPIQNHVAMLRERQMPLPELFTVTHESSTYNEGDRRSLFYAQSWLLVHYAFTESPQRWEQLIRFETLVENGASPANATAEVFGAQASKLQQELVINVNRPAMPYHVIQLDQRVATDVAGDTAPVTEPQAQAWLGDLLAHAGRTDEATALLDKALNASPDLPLAHAALGMLLLRADKPDEAVAHLERAASSTSAVSEFVLFYYGSGLMQRVVNNPGADGDLRKAIAALERAIQLRPGFTEAERTLGYAYLIGNDTVKARDTLRRALDADPGDAFLAVTLAQAELELGRVVVARQLLGPVLGRGRDQQLRERARELLALSAEIEQQQQLRSTVEPPGGSQPADAAPTSEPPPARRPASGFRPVFRTIEPGETRTYGLFTAVECTPQQVVIRVRTTGQTLDLRAPRFDAVDFISYRATAPATISCGPRQPPEEVYVTWRPDATPAGNQQGVAIAIELLPEGFVPVP